MNTLRVTGKFSFADGATDNTTYGAGDKETISVAEISFDLQADRQQTKVENMAGSLDVGDTYIVFSALKIGFKSKKMSKGAFLAHLQGTAEALSGDYYPVTVADATVKNRVGAAKLQLFHPILGSSTPAIKTPDADVITYQALAPESALSAGAETDGEFAFTMDVPAGQVIHIHKDLLPEIAALS